MDRSTIRGLRRRNKSISEIAREVGMNRKTVKAILETPVEKKYVRKGESQVDPFKERILGWHRDKVTIERMLEIARERDGDQEPYQGSRSAFFARTKQFIDEYELSRKERFVRFEGMAGEYCQVDWGEIRNFPFERLDGETRYFLAMRLKFSRKVFVKFTTDMRLETLIRGMLEGFEAFGGVAWVCVFDNMKTVTLGRDAKNRPIWHPTFFKFAVELDFHPEVCAYAAGNQKGAVESLVGWVKSNFVNGRRFLDDTDLAGQCAAWREKANTSVSQAHGEVPQAVWETEERPKFTALRTTADEYGLFSTVQSCDDCFIHIDANRYSIPVGYAERPLTARLRSRVIDFYDGEKLVAHWERRIGKQKRPCINPDHFEPVFEDKPRARVMLYRDHLVGQDRSIHAYVSELCWRFRREGYGANILELYQLWKTHGTEQLGVACALASEHGAYGVEYISALLQQPRSSSRCAVLQVAGALPQHEVDPSLADYEACAEGRDDDGQ